MEPEMWSFEVLGDIRGRGIMASVLDPNRQGIDTQIVQGVFAVSDGPLGHYNGSVLGSCVRWCETNTERGLQRQSF